jgi:hypothetical protein
MPRISARQLKTTIMFSRIEPSAGFEDGAAAAAAAPPPGCAALPLRKSPPSRLSPAASSRSGAPQGDSRDTP